MVNSYYYYRHVLGSVDTVVNERNHISELTVLTFHWKLYHIGYNVVDKARKIIKWYQILAAEVHSFLNLDTVFFNSSVVLSTVRLLCEFTLKFLPM